MKVSVIIRSKNEERFIGQVLEKIFSQDYREPFEVLVLDSGSTDHTLQIVSRFPIRLYQTDPGAFTFGRALNHGASLAAGDNVVYLSAHCVPVSNQWLSQLIAPLEDEIVVATFGRQEPVIGVNLIEELELSAVFPQDPDRPPMSIFSNANCAIRRWVIEKYPFDEEIPASEDFLWRKLLPEEMCSVYVSTASVYHSHPPSLRYWAGRFRINGECVQYLDRRLGIQYSWGSPKDNFRKLSRNWRAMVSREMRYVWSQGRPSMLFWVPIFETVRIAFYLYGLRRGAQRYSRSVSERCGAIGID
jgi:glycosyltransferase involved in cell wall biosynthesis